MKIFIRSPKQSGISQRHILNESHRHLPLQRQPGEIDKLVIINASHGNAIDFDGIESNLLGPIQPR